MCCTCKVLLFCPINLVAPLTFRYRRLRGMEEGRSQRQEDPRSRNNFLLGLNAEILVRVVEQEL